MWKTRKLRNKKPINKNKKGIKKQKQKGAGGLSCEAEGFNLNIRKASLGSNYPKLKFEVGAIHADGEKRSFENLVDFSQRGLFDWYARKAGLTEEDYLEICQIPELNILGAFFHRYKIVSENISLIRRILKKGPKEFFTIASEKTWASFLENPKIKSKNLPWKPNAIFLSELDNEKFFAIDIPIETIIDKVQCLIWIIIKNKSLPSGFIMNKLIEEKAKTPILINGDTPLAEEHLPLKKLEKVRNWIQFIIKESNEFSSETFDFGVF